MVEDQRTRLLEKKARIDARLKALALIEQKQKRRADTRRKIIAGALALEHGEQDAEFGRQMAALLNRYVTRPSDRTLFHFLDDRMPDASLPHTAGAADTFTVAAMPPHRDKHGPDSAVQEAA
jgi:hypothetical protein